MTTRSTFLFGALGVVLLLLSQGLFIVEQTEQALVLELGRLVRVIKTPGLYLKTPFIQNVLSYDKRTLGLTLPPTEITLSDQKRSVVDMFVRYRIGDPVQFYKAVRSENGALSRIMPLTSGILRSTLGKRTLKDLLSDRRAEIMQHIMMRTNEALDPLGLTVVDVRIVRADLPAQNSLAIFDRMTSERKKEAREIRAVGEERSQLIKAHARLQGRLLIAEAIKKAATIRATAEKKAQDIYIEAYAQDAEFAYFYQTLEAYRHSLKKKTFYILTPKHPFLTYFHPHSAKKP